MGRVVAVLELEGGGGLYAVEIDVPNGFHHLAVATQKHQIGDEVRFRKGILFAAPGTEPYAIVLPKPE